MPLPTGLGSHPFDGESASTRSALDVELVARRLRDELDVEAGTGRGDGAWGEARHSRALAEARRRKSGPAHQPG